MTEQQIEEGWGVIRPGDRRHHYYRKAFSLCRRVGFYSGPLDPEQPGASKKAMALDCAACRKVLHQEAAREAWAMNREMEAS